MAETTSDSIKRITRKHLTDDNGLLFGQCVTAVGWIGGTIPDCEGIIEIPMTDVAGPGFAVGAALMGRRPIFVVRYQGFMWYNCSSLVNYASRSKAVWGKACPVFIRSLGMEGNGVGHTASSCLHSIFMHPPGMPVAAPVTPQEYQSVWNYFMDHDDPIYVSEHRKSYTVSEEMPDIYRSDADITVFPISGARLNMKEAEQLLLDEGISCNICPILWLKPFRPSNEVLDSLRKTGIGLVVDSDFEIAGASRSISYELMHLTGASVHALGLKDQVCGATATQENITPSPEEISARIIELLSS